MNQKFSEQVDAIDLLIATFFEHEKNLSELIGNLIIATDKLNQIVDKIVVKSGEVIQ
jgi:hypothetical protein